MHVVFCGIVPHPPIAVPEVGGKEADVILATRQAMAELGRRIKESGAEALVLISPHAPVFGDGIAINARAETTGDLSRFGAPQVSLTCRYDRKLGTEIGWQAEELGVAVIEVDDEMARQTGVNLSLDHGYTVPLYYLRQAGADLPMVPCSMGVFSPEKLYAFGVAVKKAAETLGRKVAVVASGDLSHRLTPDAPAGYDPLGKEFDLKIAALINNLDMLELIGLEEDFCERAGECGLRPITMMMGALEGSRVVSEVLSYEGPFGVGYLVASLEPIGEEPERYFLPKMQEAGKKVLEQRRTGESFLVKVARASLESYLEGNWKTPESHQVPEEFAAKAGVFVSLKLQGRLRGCIGTTSPTRKNMVQEVAYNAVSAGIRDPRFYPVRLDELEELDISVDVLTAPEPIDTIEQLDVKKYGVIVHHGSKSGLLLPDLEGIDTPQQQVEIARQKAGIAPGESVRLERFEVIRYR